MRASVRSHFISAGGSLFKSLESGGAVMPNYGSHLDLFPILDALVERFACLWCARHPELVND